jgi:hypothetical protein
MQIPVIEGRAFTGSDGPDHPVAVIVNEALAKKYFGTADAVGHQVKEQWENHWATVVGVIGDVRNTRLEDSAAPQLYRSFYQGVIEANAASITVRSGLPKDAVVKLIRGVIRGLDPSLAIGDVHMMSDLETGATARRRFQTSLLTVFSAVAMLLAIVGVYGLLAYSVRRRTAEIGIRMALGSTRRSVIGLVLREGLVLLGAGLGIGMAAALGLTRTLSGFLYGISAIDPVRPTCWCLCCCWWELWRPVWFQASGRLTSNPWPLCGMTNLKPAVQCTPIFAECRNPLC